MDRTAQQAAIHGNTRELKTTVRRVNPRLIHVNVWQKPLQYCKVISLQLIKINGKNQKIKIKKKENDCVTMSQEMEKIAIKN